MAGELDEIIRRVKEIPKLAERSAPDCAEALQSSMRSDLEAGQSPDGIAWKPTVDGKRPLKNAANALVVRAIGSTLMAVVRGHHFFHHRGTEKVPVRSMLPTELPAKHAEAIRTVLVDRFNAEVRGK